MSLLSFESPGVIVSAIFWVSLFPLEPFILKNTRDTFVRSSPLFSIAAIVFSKVGLSGLLMIASSSARLIFIPSSNAGR